MESHTTAPITNNTSSTSSFEDAPLLNLLSRPLSEMSIEELRAHVQELREVSSSPVTLKKKISDEKQTEKKSSIKPAADAKKMLSKYLNM